MFIWAFVIEGASQKTLEHFKWRYLVANQLFKLGYCVCGMCYEGIFVFFLNVGLEVLDQAVMLCRILED